MFNYLNFLFARIFNKRNFIKILIIFSFGLCTRIFINSYFNVNVFVDCFSFVSMLYYLFMASFVLAVNIIVDTFDPSIFPSFAILPSVTELFFLQRYKEGWRQEIIGFILHSIPIRFV